MTPGRPTVTLCGGIVAYNERERVGTAIQSLLAQQLPDGAAWSELTVVVSGSTDGTEDVVRALAAADPRIRLVVQPGREGKSAALTELFRHARGDYLVFLNGDARAEPGSVAALLSAAAGPAERFAVMGRPAPPAARPGTFGAVVELMCRIHHVTHVAFLAEGRGNHLSDELLLLPVRDLPPIGPGIINDGSFVGAWLAVHGGTLRYAPEAIATIVTPATFREHVRQRRRIVYGHHQIQQELGVRPMTITRFGLSAPREAVRLVRQECHRRGALQALTTLLAAEAVARALALVDRGSRGRAHVRWNPIRGSTPEPALDGPGPTRAADGS